MGLRFLAAILCTFIFGNSAFANGVTAKSWLVSNASGEIIRGTDVDTVRPIASISKLFTAMIVLDARQDLDENLTLSKRLGGKLPSKQTYSRRVLIQLAVTHSDNRAAMTLCENYPGGYSSCIVALNDKAQQLKMQHTALSDPTGLDVRNVSNARELILLVQAAKHYPLIVEASQQAKVEVKLRKKWFFFNNTNPMVGKKHTVIVSKTGFINASGGCIVLLMNTDLGDRVVVVLGSKNTHTRIPEAEFISTMKEEW